MSSFFNKPSVKWSCLTIAIIYSLSFYFWDYSTADHFYWLNMTWLKDYNALHVMSLWCIDLWCQVFGRSLISTRILAFLIDTSALLLPYFCLLKKEEHNKYVYYLCAAFVIMGPAMVKCCNPDNFSAIFFSFIITIFVLYAKSKNLKTLVLLMVITAISGLFKMPNLIIAPLIAIFLFLLIKERKERIIYSIVFLVSSILLYLVILGLCYKTTDPISYLAFDLNKYSTGVKNSHNLPALTVEYVKSFIRGVISVAVVFVPLLICRRLDEKKKNYWLWIVTGLFSFGLLCYLEYTMFYNFGMFEMLLVLALAFSIPLFIYYSKDNRPEDLYILLFICLALFVPSAGSDCGFIKSKIVSCAFLPIIVGKTYSIIGGKRIAIYALVIVSIVSIIVHYYKSFPNYKVYSNQPMVAGVLGSPANKEYIDFMESEYSQYFTQDHVVFIGDGHHTQMFYAIFNTKPLYAIAFRYVKDNEGQINKAIDALNKNKDNVIIDETGSDVALFVSKGLHIVAQKDNYTVYSY